MNALIVLIPVTFLALVVAAVAFFWAVRHGQFRNIETPEILPLLDDEDHLVIDDSGPDATGHPCPKEAQP